MKIVHFLGASKPWHLAYDLELSNLKRFASGDSIQTHHLFHCQERNMQTLLEMWWHILFTEVLSTLRPGLVKPLNAYASNSDAYRHVAVAVLGGFSGSSA